MSGPHKNFPLTQREWHEQAAAIAYQPPQAQQKYQAPPAANPFTSNPALVKDEP